MKKRLKRQRQEDQDNVGELAESEAVVNLTTARWKNFGWAMYTLVGPPLVATLIQAQIALGVSIDQPMGRIAPFFAAARSVASRRAAGARGAATLSLLRA